MKLLLSFFPPLENEDIDIVYSPSPHSFIHSLNTFIERLLCAHTKRHQTAMLLAQPQCPEAALVWAGDLNSPRGSVLSCSAPCSPGGPPYSRAAPSGAGGSAAPPRPASDSHPPTPMVSIAILGNGGELQVFLGFAAGTHSQRSVPLVFTQSSLLLSFVPANSVVLGGIQEACGPAVVSGFHQLGFKEEGGDLGSWGGPSALLKGTDPAKVGSRCFGVVGKQKT